MLCYTSSPLDADLEVIGPVRLELYAHSSLLHTDFCGRLCDVDPAGRSLNVCDGLFRVLPRAAADAEASVPATGQPALPENTWRIEIDMWVTAHRFRAGHRVRLQVSSGAFPRWSRNLGAGGPLATGVVLAVAEQTIYHDTARPSALVLPVVGEG